MSASSTSTPGRSTSPSTTRSSRSLIRTAGPTHRPALGRQLRDRGLPQRHDPGAARLRRPRNSALQFVNVGGERGAQTLRAVQSAIQLRGVWREPVLVLAGCRAHDWRKAFSSNRTYSNKGGFAANPVPQFANTTYQGINPKIGLLWQPLPEVQVFGDVTGSRDVPDFSDLVQQNTLRTTFVPLRAQRAVTYEARQPGPDRPALLGRGRSTARKFATNSSLLDQRGSTSRPRPSTHRGPGTRAVEAAVALDLARDLITATTGSRSRRSGPTTTSASSPTPCFRDNRIAGIPTDVLRSVLTYRRRAGLPHQPVRGLGAAGGLRGPRANTLKMPGYALFKRRGGESISPTASRCSWMPAT